MKSRKGLNPNEEFTLTWDHSGLEVWSTQSARIGSIQPLLLHLVWTTTSVHTLTVRVGIKFRDTRFWSDWFIGGFCQFCRGKLELCSGKAELPLGCCCKVRVMFELGTTWHKTSECLLKYWGILREKRTLERSELKSDRKMKLNFFRSPCVTSAQFTYFLKIKLPP